MTETQAAALEAGDAFLALLVIMEDACWAGTVRDLLAEMRMDMETDDDR
ncbi:hypothetical protein N8569_00905 [bacterium]|nr:hypothetical protein [bacterium]